MLASTKPWSPSGEESVPGNTLAPDELSALVVAQAPLERIDIIRSGEIVETLPGQGLEVMSFRRRLPDLSPGEYVYLRAVQRDDGAAWSSPFFIEGPAAVSR